MDYLYDVFISYRRHPEWTPWTREHIRNLLDAYLTPELSTRPDIFVDEQIEPAADWPQRLGDSLARSRVLLPIFSGDYFSSDWCLHELDLMHGRLIRFPGTKLIVPVIGHDGELIPIEIARLQPVSFIAFRNTDLQRRTPRYEQFSDAVRNLAPHVAAAIASVPPFDPVWVLECRKRFDKVYKAHGGGPRARVQTLTLKPLPRRPISPPRVIL
jgi:TIR domain